MLLVNFRKRLKRLFYMVGRERLERSTIGLKVQFTS